MHSPRARAWSGVISPGVREEALELLGRRSAWLNVVVLDADRQYMNARVAEDEPLPEVTSREIIEEAMRTKAPVVGQVVSTPGAQGCGGRGAGAVRAQG